MQSTHRIEQERTEQNRTEQNRTAEFIRKKWLYHTTVYQVRTLVMELGSHITPKFHTAFVHSSIHLSIYPSIHSFIHKLVNSCVSSFKHSIIYPSTNSNNSRIWNFYSIVLVSFSPYEVCESPGMGLALS